MSTTNAPSADDFPATAHAAWQRLRAIQPSAYARSRNHLEGAVTRLSPYITHGVLSLGQVARQLQDQHGLTGGFVRSTLLGLVNDHCGALFSVSHSRDSFRTASII